MTKVYVTKYALSKGIEEIESDIYNNPRHPERKYINYGMLDYAYIGTNVFFTRKEAIKKAEEMREKKIVSLRKQIEKLEKLKFD